MSETDYETLWQQVWDETLHNELEDPRSEGWEPEQFYTSGRASKDFPNKEDPSWWKAKGPGFVKSWVNWRNNCGLDIWTAPDGTPGIELHVEAEAPLPGGKVLSYIDRVMIDPETGFLYIVDLKSGSNTPAWPRQMALNNLGLLHTYGVWAEYAGFWSPRKGGIHPDWFDLRIYDEDWLWKQVGVARQIRDQGLFAAQPTMLCNTACSVREYCKAVGGALSLTTVQA